MTFNSSNKNRIRSGDPEIIRELCRNLRQMRLNKNWSQSQLAEFTGLDRVTISRMENGRAATLLTFVQVLRALDKLQLLDVFNEQPEQSPLQLLKLQEKQRQKASPRKNKKPKRRNIR